MHLRTKDIKKQKRQIQRLYFVNFDTEEVKIFKNKNDRYNDFTSSVSKLTFFRK